MSQEATRLQLVRHMMEINRLLVECPDLQPMACKLAELAILNPCGDSMYALQGYAPGVAQSFTITTNLETREVCSIVGIPLPYEFGAVPIVTSSGAFNISPVTLSDDDIERYAPNDPSVAIHRLQASGIVKEHVEFCDELLAENAALHAENTAHMRGNNQDEDGTGETK